MLVGLMGTGKTTVGRLVAERRDMRHVDLDDVVEMRRGCSVAHIFALEGEASFRRVEREALIDALNGDPCVVSTGGGIVESEMNRTDLRRAACVVWLDASVGVLVSRVGGSDSRPLLDGNATASLARLASRRREWYESVAHVRVDTDGRSPDEVAARVVEIMDTKQ